jgi:hypothetical protein
MCVGAFGETWVESRYMVYDYVYGYCRGKQDQARARGNTWQLSLLRPWYPVPLIPPNEYVAQPYIISRCTDQETHFIQCLANRHQANHRAIPVSHLPVQEKRFKVLQLYIILCWTDRDTHCIQYLFRKFNHRVSI